MSYEPRSSPTFTEVLAARLDRRSFLRAGAAAAGAAALAPVFDSLTSVSFATGARPHFPAVRPLAFAAIGPSTDDEVKVPAGYSASYLIGWGDPLRPGLPSVDRATMTAADQAQRFGYNCDFVAFLPLSGDGRFPDRGLLWVNHESTDEILMFSPWARSEPQVAVALAAHGGSLLEVRRLGGTWTPELRSPFNRRITATTPMVLTGPAAGHEWLRTREDPSGRFVRGMLSNCSGGVTPWGTILTAEENFDHYFAGKEKFGGDRTVGEAHDAYLTTPKDKGWERYHGRFDVAAEPHEPFRFGWIVEIDPYDPHCVPKKRTALGRFKHEAAVTVLSADGRPVVYSGDDEADQYVYKFIGARPVHHRQRGPGGDLLDHGTLSVARFEADGTGTWIPLTFGPEPLCPEQFTSQADVLIRARQAARAVEATRMDRPEDIEVSPQSGCVYLSMTMGPKRDRANGANPRVPNKLGHVIELTENGGDPAATQFRWEIFLLCGHPDRLVTDLAGPPPGPETSYFAGYGRRRCDGKECLSPIATPDNLVFDDAGHLWIATDGQTEALSGYVAANDALHAVPTRGPERGRVQQFLSAPIGAEVTGPCFSPDHRALFVSIQHPGRGTTKSLWPDRRHPPRPSVVVVTKDDGGVIGT